MQLGVGNNAAPSRSVGQRIKEASLKDVTTSSSQLGLNNSNSPGGCSGNAASSAAWANSLANTSNRQSRTSIRHSDQCSQLKHCPPKVLSERQRNTIRIIGQYLRNLGMNDTVESLVEESGCRIESAQACRLQEYVLHGAWCKALEILEKFKPSITERQYLTVRVLLLEEEFKSLMANEEVLLALRLLQVEYPKNKEFRDRYEYLAALLMSESYACNASKLEAASYERPMNEENTQNNPIDGENANNQAVLKIVYKVLPPTLMLPPERLEELLKQSWMYQIKQCDLHVFSNEEIIDERAILKNHQCSSHDFPAKNSQVLGDHFAEVWCLEFSPCGKYLASGAKSNCVLIWKVIENQNIRVYRRLQIPADVTGIASLSWSSDSKYLAIASTEENAFGVFIYNIYKSYFVKEYRPNQNDSFSVVCFFKDNSHRLACGDQRGHFHVYDVDRPDDSLRNFEGFRIRCIYSKKDGKTVLAADTHNRIRSYEFETQQESTIIQEMSQIMYFTVDHHTEEHCLVTTKTEGIRLWCLRTRSLIRSFFGSMHSEFVITSSFGGFNGNFVASGSEDENVVIWNADKSEPVRCLRGHTGTVNAVSWNPKYHGMLASGSDDGTIRIWTSSTST